MDAALDPIEHDRRGHALGPADHGNAGRLRFRRRQLGLRGGLSAPVDPAEERDRAIRRPDGPLAALPALIVHPRIGRSAERQQGERCIRAARAAVGLRHVRFEGRDRREQIGGVAGHAVGHETASREAGEIDALRIGDATPHEIGHQRPQECDVVSEFAAGAKELRVLGPAIIPCARHAFGKHRDESVLLRARRQSAAACDALRAAPGAVEHDDGRARIRARCTFDQIAALLTSDRQAAGQSRRSSASRRRSSRGLGSHVALLVRGALAAKALLSSLRHERIACRRKIGLPREALDQSPAAGLYAGAGLLQVLPAGRAHRGAGAAIALLSDCSAAAVLRRTECALPAHSLLVPCLLKERAAHGGRAGLLNEAPDQAAAARLHPGAELLQVLSTRGLHPVLGSRRRRSEVLVCEQCRKRDAGNAESLAFHRPVLTRRNVAPRLRWCRARDVGHRDLSRKNARIVVGRRETLRPQWSECAAFAGQEAAGGADRGERHHVQPPDHVRLLRARSRPRTADASAAARRASPNCRLHLCVGLAGDKVHARAAHVQEALAPGLLNWIDARHGGAVIPAAVLIVLCKWRRLTPVGPRPPAKVRNFCGAVAPPAPPAEAGVA